MSTMLPKRKTTAIAITITHLRTPRDIIHLTFVFLFLNLAHRQAQRKPQKHFFVIFWKADHRDHCARAYPDDTNDSNVAHTRKEFLPYKHLRTQLNIIANLT